MTDSPKPDDQQPENAQQSLSLLADHKDLLRLRLLPVELAKVLNVTKQTISVWIKEGKITPPSPIDGRLDAQAAVRQVLRNTPPGKIRARILRQATEDAQALRDNLARAEDRTETAEAALRDALEQIAHLERWSADGDAHLVHFHALLIERAEHLRATTPEAWEQAIDDLIDAAWDAVDAKNGKSSPECQRESLPHEWGGGDCSAADDAP